MKGTRAVLVAASVVAGLLGSALAGVDAEVGGNVKAKGTLAPSGEVESFTFDAVTGTLLTVSVKADGKSGLDPAISLVNPDSEEEAELAPPALVDEGSTVSLRSFPIPATGRWTLRVSGEGSGGYSLSLKTKAPKSAADSRGIGPGSESVFEFAAPRGSVLGISAKAAKGSVAVPRLVALTPDGGEDVDLSSAGKLKPTSHSVSVAAPGEGGGLTLYLTNAGEAAGDVEILVKIKAPKAKPMKLDLRATALGNPGGGGTYVSRLVDSDGGTVAAGDGPLSGAVLEIPEGALSQDVNIALASAPAPSLPSGDDQAAGPAVDLQPSGLRFDVPALLTLPFDPALVPANADPSDLRVLVVEDDGETFEILPSSVDEEGGTISLAIDGFSICIPVIRSGLAPLGVAPGGDEYWNLTLEYGIEPDPASGDSRARSFLLEVGETSFYGDNTVQTSSSWRTVGYLNSTSSQGIDAVVQASEFPQEYGATWSYGADGRTIEVQEGDGGPILASSRDGSVLLEHGEEDEEGTGFILLLRKMAVPFTAESLQGTWLAGGVELAVDAQGQDAPASVDIRRSFLAVTFDGAGGVTFSENVRTAEADPQDGSIRYGSEGGSGTATTAIQGDGTVLVSVPPHEGDDTGDVLRIYPGRNGDVMFLVDDGPCGTCTYAMILIRQGSGLSPAVLDGTYLGTVFGVDLDSYAPAAGGGGPAAFSGDPHLSVLDFAGHFDGDGSASLEGTEHGVRRDEGEVGGVLSELSPLSTALGVAVDAKGKLTLSPTGQPGLIAGAVSSDGMFAFLVTSPSVGDADFGLGFMVKAPPAAE